MATGHDESDALTAGNVETPLPTPANAMNASITVRVTSIQDVKYDEFSSGRIEREPDPPFTNAQTVLANERLDGLNVSTSGPEHGGFHREGFQR